MLKRMCTVPYALLVQVILLLALTAPSLAATKEGMTISDLPPAAQASISTVIGRDDADYHLQKTAAGYKAVNSGHRLSAAFSADGPTISNGTDSWSLRLSAFGRENDLQSVSPAVVTSDANRVEYRRSNLVEWYVNGPVGLEQGFTIPSRPSGPAETMLVIAMTGSGLKPVASEAGALMLVRADGSEAFSYGGLAAWDADGRTLPVQLVLVGDQVQLRVDDQSARFPLTVDPVFQIARLNLLDDGAANDYFGNSVALSGDGNTALIGAYNKTIGANAFQGVAYVFTRLGTAWSLQARLTAADGAANDLFGYSVALSSDGSTALIGATNVNAAYAFTRSGGSWGLQARLTADDGAASDYFGESVALSSDGSTALIGAHNKTIGVNPSQGAAYVFTRSWAWSQQARLTAADGAASDYFGKSVALSGDGSTALIGAFIKAIGANDNQGASYVFTRSYAWSQQARLTAADGAANDNFGISAALSSDGSTALIGANLTNDYQGASYVFTRKGSVWSQQARLTADSGGYYHFGISVALSSDGSTALIGANNDHAAYAFTRSGSVWSQQARLTASDSALHDSFGYSVALSSDGSTALIGADYKTIGVNDHQGASYAFTRSGSVWSQQARLTLADGAASDNFGNSVSLSSDGSTALIGAYGKQFAYVFTFSGTSWSLQARLTASDGAANDNFGNSVALSSDGSTALIGAYKKTIVGNFEQGAAYAFTRSGSTWRQHARLTASDGAASDRFGWSVALSSDGSTALIGATNKTIGLNSFQGAAYAYIRSGSTWNQQERLTAADGAASDRFGRSVALSSEGDTALIGADNKTIGANNYQGAAYAFTRSGTAWSQQARLTAADGATYDFFGYSVSLSSDGNTALIGAYYKTIGVNAGQGAAYVFIRSGATWNQQARLTAADGETYDFFGYSASLSGDGSTALIGASNKTFGSIFAQQGAAYAFTRSGTTWSQQDRLTASDGAASDYFGWQVALSSDSIVGLIGAYNKTIGANAEQGAAYLFVFSPRRCSAGSYDNGTDCTPCPAGSFQNMPLQKACIAAPVGYYVTSGGAVAAAACSPGSYQDLTGQTFCKACPAGSYQPSIRQSACLQAPPGYFVPSPGATAPQPCAGGTAQGNSGASSCTACAAGTLQPAPGQSACVTIPKAANSVVFDPANLQNLFAGIDAAGIYIGTNGGTSWIPATTQPTNNRIKALVLKPGDPAKQFAATYGGGVFTSADSGFNWTACRNTNLTNLNVVSLAIAANGTLYAGTEDGIFTSADSCATWTAMNNGLPPQN